MSKHKQDDQAVTQQDIGRFIVGVGAIIKHPTENKILITQRDKTDFETEAWQLMYGRINQGEELTEALMREIKEELGSIKVKIERVIRIWHFYRGEKKADNESYIVTFVCQALDTNIELGPESSAYLWNTPEEALKKIEFKSVRHDVKQFIHDQTNNTQGVYLSDINHKLINL